MHPSRPTDAGRQAGAAPRRRGDSRDLYGRLLLAAFGLLVFQLRVGVVHLPADFDKLVEHHRVSHAHLCVADTHSGALLVSMLDSEVVA